MYGVGGCMCVLCMRACLCYDLLMCMRVCVVYDFVEVCVLLSFVFIMCLL